MKGILLIFLLLAITTISACGKMSPTKPYDGSGYPHSYPRK